MISWHEKTCRKPHILLADRIPFCANCGNIASFDVNSVASFDTPDTAESCHRDLDLTWPSSVSYITNPALREDEHIIPGVLQRSKLIDPRNAPLQPHAFESQNYESLQAGDNIRLLRLEKGFWDDPLHGTLISSPLDSQISYEAVSYTWADENGDSKRSCILYLEDSWVILPITRNCEAALRRFRRSKTDRLLWIDAVCINQNNIPERSHQVAMMPKIYSTATSCLVYLGECQHGSEMAMRLIAQYQLPSRVTEEMSMALSRLFMRPYFSRTWILQELVLSSSVIVHCGNSTARWNQITSKSWESYPDIYVPSWVKNFEICRYRQALDFPRWIFEMGSTTASDPRDKIFAIMGLFRGLEDEGLTPDYSLTTAQVYTGVAAYLLTKHNMRHIITVNQNPTSGLPSWVPDWRSVKYTQWLPRPVEYDIYASSRGVEYEPSAQDTHDFRRLFQAPTKKARPSNNSTIEINKNSGALVIQLEYLFSLGDFMASSNPFSLRWPQAWTLESSITATSEHYIGSVEGQKYCLILKKVSDTQIYRIVGRCCLTFSLTRRLVGEARTIGHDPVRFWAKEKLNFPFWRIYTRVDCYPMLDITIQTAIKEYMLISNPLVNLQGRLLSESSPIATACPNARLLVQCVRFWTDLGIREFMLHFFQGSQGFTVWQRLRESRVKWLYCRKALLDQAYSTIPSDPETRRYHANLLTLTMPRTQAYFDLLKRTIGLFDIQSSGRNLVKGEELISFLYNELDLWNKTNLEELARTSIGDLVKGAMTRVTERARYAKWFSQQPLDILEEIIKDNMEEVIYECCIQLGIGSNNGDEKNTFTKFLEKAEGHTSWHETLDIVREIQISTNTNTHSSMEASDFLKEILKRVFNDLVKENEVSASDAWKFSLRGIESDRLALRTLTNPRVVKIIKGLDDEFGQLYTAAFKGLQTRIREAHHDYFGRHGSINGSMTTIESIIAQAAPTLVGHLRSHHHNFAEQASLISSFIGMSMVMERGSKVTIL
ncbi:hypothetical protein M426DRAFT_322525 [Hypoxylon sp. CI-4A]|nr:hypothetical protein M426DRAFT_322525 [Hypoxylon sp. CI-4A]